MIKRLINAGVLITLYLVFLAWYGGWGMSPMTTAEVDSISRMFRRILRGVISSTGCGIWVSTTTAKKFSC